MPSAFRSCRDSLRPYSSGREDIQSVLPASFTPLRTANRSPVMASHNILHAFSLQKPEGFLQAVEQWNGGRVGHIARGVGLQHVLQVVVALLQLSALPYVQGLQKVLRPQQKSTVPKELSLVLGVDPELVLYSVVKPPACSV